MGKSLSGKELGEGISQRKDGRFSARYRSINGKRVEKYFGSVPEAKKWLEKAKYEDRNIKKLAPFDTVAKDIIESDAPLVPLSDMTVDQWFEFWLNNIVADRAYNTRRNYTERYYKNIKPVIGNVKLNEVLPYHCQKVVNRMKQSSEYANSTIKQTYITLGTLFKAAKEHRAIEEHPLDGLNIRFPQKEKSDIRFLSVEDETKFFEQAKRSHNYDQYQFVRETGIRCGELIALCFSDIDWDNGTVEINKTMEFRYKSSEWRAGSPKTIAGYRTLPLTKKAYKILRRLYEGKSERFESGDLNQVLEFTDRKTGKKRYLDMKDLVFVNYRTGMPVKNSSYNTHLYKLCEEAGIAPFSMHTLRHTYATRAIAAGVSPKALQKLLGHEHVSTSMDTYVGLSEDSKRDAVRLLEEYSNN